MEQETPRGRRRVRGKPLPQEGVTELITAPHQEDDGHHERTYRRADFVQRGIQ